MATHYSILINTCDKFEDCWDPFFKLMAKYWSDCKGKIFLNTEFKDYSYPNLSITAVKGCVNKQYKGKFATWSQCLRWALDKIDTDIVLYMQEDYFLKAPVKNNVVEKYVRLMDENPEIKCLHLTDQASTATRKSDYEGLNIVDTKQRYRVSCQAALWRKEELLSLIRDYESAWEFEEFGSQRSSKINHLYLTVDRNVVKLNEYEIIPYIFTGIVQGKWIKECIKLFADNDIHVDFSKRGFNEGRAPKKLCERVKYRFKKIPKIIRNKIELAKL